MDNSKLTKLMLKRILQNKILFAEQNRKIAEENEDGSDIYWQGVMLMAEDALNLVNRLK